MNLGEKRERRSVVGRFGLCIACMLVIFVSLFTLSGCSGGPSKEEQAKQDEQGKQTNEAAMNRMLQEQGRGGMPTAGGQGTPGGAPTPGGMPAPGGMPPPGGK